MILPHEAKKADGYHVPVLLQESVDALVTDPEGVYLDVTLGGGGHSRAILSRLGRGGHLFGFDRDEDAQHSHGIEDERFTFVRSDFRYLAHFMEYYGISEVDGILADLGVSSHHLDDETRGFSFRFDAPLDMRMNRSGGITAHEWLQKCTLECLTQVLKDNGEVKGAYRIAHDIIQAREASSLDTVADLLRAIERVCPREDKKNLARIFQALRIEVNAEMDSLRTLLEEGSHLLRPGGRMVVITYHSLEDRPVKGFFREGNLKGIRETDLYGVPLAQMTPLYSKPILPSQEEQERNPRSRSAKLRIGVKK